MWKILAVLMALLAIGMFQTDRPQNGVILLVALVVMYVIARGLRGKKNKR